MLAESIKSLRQSAFMSQEELAKELKVSVSTINRWETGRVRPNLSAMRKIKDFCKNNGLPFENIELEWRDYLSNSMK